MKTMQNHRERHSTTGHLLLLLGVGILLTGCAPLGPRLTSVRGERVSAGVIEVTSIQTRAEKRGGILVLGDVRKLGQYPAPIESHLDVYALDGQGRTLAARATRYSPWSIPQVRHGYENHASYSVYLTAVSEAVQTVRVAHHPVALDQCELAQMARH